MSTPIQLDDAAAAEPGSEPVVKFKAPITRRRLVARRFFRNPTAIFGLVVLVALVLFAFAGGHLSKWDYQEIDPFALNTAPRGSHFFGTNQIGQDVYAQTVRGLQKSLIIGFLVAILTTVIAAVVGAAAGYFGGVIDRALMWVVDALLVIPSFLIIAICSPAFQGKSYLLLVILLAVFSWMVSARMIRALTRSAREREYVRAAQYMGASPMTVIRQHVIPTFSSILIVDMTLAVGAAIVGEAGLSFFGFGVQRPDVSLGTLIADGTSSALTYPWLFGFCIGSLVLTVLSINFIGDGLRDALDPNSTRGQAKS